MTPILEHEVYFDGQLETTAESDVYLVNVDVDRSMDVEVQADVEDDVNNTAVGLQWSKYTPQMLRAPLHPALQARCAPVEEDTVPVPSGSGIQKTSCVPQHKLQETSPGINVPAIGDECEVLQSPKVSFNRRKPTIQNKIAPLSLSGKKLEPWVVAKTELTRESLNHLKRKQETEAVYEQELQDLRKKELELNIEYVQRNQEEKQRREAELHDLRKRELQLSIKVKEETLKKIMDS